MKARICRLYQKAKKGDQQAFYCLENIGIRGNKVEVLRKIEEIVKDQNRQVYCRYRAGYMKITKNKILASLEKDIILIKKHQSLTKEYVKAGCGQFLNVGNDTYCGNYEEVLNLFDDMLKWANKLKVKLSTLKIEPKHGITIDIDCEKKRIYRNPSSVSDGGGYINFIYDFFESTFKSSESLIFLDEINVNPMDSNHHTLFPNLAKLIERSQD